MSLTLPPATRDPRFVLFGNLCHFTTVFLRQMLEAGIEVTAIILPGLPSSDIPHQVRVYQPGSGVVLPSARTERLTDIALSASVPVYRIGRLGSGESIALLRSLEADCLLSVCFPRRIPDSFIEAVDVPALNVHPSMLPELRGPDPIFWTLNEGSGRSGLTIHHLTARLDAGPIAAQRRHEYMDGTTEHDLEAELAQIAVRMLVEMLPAVVSGQIPAEAQSEQDATYARFPKEDDYRIDSSWSAKRAFNFASGLISRGVPLIVNVSGTNHVITRVYAYEEPERNDLRGVSVRMSDGYLVADLRPAHP
jgi:methionyl-tRNA formyltransferase